MSPVQIRVINNWKLIVANLLQMRKLNKTQISHEYFLSHLYVCYSVFFLETTKKRIVSDNIWFLLSFSCPHDCDNVISESYIRSVLDDAEYERWENIVFSRVLDAMDDIGWLWLFYCVDRNWPEVRRLRIFIWFGYRYRANYFGVNFQKLWSINSENHIRFCRVISPDLSFSFDPCRRGWSK